VKAPNTDDQKKMSAKWDLSLTLEADAVVQAGWWVDASFGIHHVMKSDKGGIMSGVVGAIYVTLRRQRLNARSSIKSELVGINDVLSQVLWTWYFMESQGYHVHPIKLYQDNMSTILLGKNGKATSSKHTWHIDIRYTGWQTRRLRPSSVHPVTCLLTF